MKREFSAGVIAYHPDQQGRRLYLVLQYPSGYWDLPKGKLERGETHEQAARRELFEETGLAATLDAGFKETLSYFFHAPETREPVSKQVTFFLGKTNALEVTLSHEHLGFQWLPLEDALQQLTFKNARQIVSQADMFLRDSLGE